MSNNSDTALFELLKSLTKQEKRHFKLYASRHVIGSDNIYIKVFDAVNKQDEYDEKLLLNKFKNETFAKHFPVTKHNLYTLILKSLNAFHSDIHSETNRMIHSFNILYNKSLYTQCEKILRKVKKTASDYEMFEKQLELEQLDAKLHIAMYNTKKFSRFIQQSSAEKHIAIKKINNLLDYRQNYYEMSLLIGLTDLPRERKLFLSYEDIINKPIFKNSMHANSFLAKYYFYSTQYFYYRAKGDLKNNYTFQKKLVLLLESNPKMIVADCHKYIAALHHYIITLAQLKKYDEALINVKRLKELLVNYNIPNTEETRIRIFSRAYNAEMGIYLNTGEFKRGLTIAPTVEDWVGRYASKLTPQQEIFLHYNLFHTYFGVGKYKPALLYLNAVLNNKSIKSFPEILSSVYVINIVVHFELQNIDLIKYIIKSAYRYLLNHKRLYKMETTTLKFFQNRIHKLNSREEQKHAFLELRDELIKIMKDPLEQRSLSFFDFISWLESKISGKSFAEIVRQKADTINGIEI
mgnify:FL=1